VVIRIVVVGAEFVTVEKVTGSVVDGAAAAWVVVVDATVSSPLHPASSPDATANTAPPMLPTFTAAPLKVAVNDEQLASVDWVKAS
jgi:hypothetical protein